MGLHKKQFGTSLFFFFPRLRIFNNLYILEKTLFEQYKQRKCYFDILLVLYTLVEGCIKSMLNKVVIFYKTCYWITQKNHANTRLVFIFIYHFSLYFTQTLSIIRGEKIQLTNVNDEDNIHKILKASFM